MSLDYLTEVAQGMALFFIGYGGGILTGRNYMRRIAIKKGLARYECDPYTGEAVFTWNRRDETQ